MSYVRRVPRECSWMIQDGPRPEPRYLPFPRMDKTAETGMEARFGCLSVTYY
jgi:hypothetical protein